MSRFALSSGSPSTSATTPANVASPAYTSDNEADEEDNLPYPGELPRSDFLKPDFDPQIYLSSLRNRHQTLEDLRTDLRERSQLLNRELLDLVNGNYEEFLSLGSDLKGGEEKVEGVRVGLLGFRREIESLQIIAGEREAEVSRLLQEKSKIRQEVVLGRKLLEVQEQVENLEEIFGIRGRETIDEDADTDDDEDDVVSNEDSIHSQARRLERRTEQYLLVTGRFDQLGPQHPFLTTLQPRMDEIRKTLLLDLSSALRQAKSTRDSKTLLILTNVFGDLGAENEAMKVLKSTH